MLGSFGRWRALLRRILYNQVLGRGLMWSRVVSPPPLARSRVEILDLGSKQQVFWKTTALGGAHATAHASHGPVGPMGAQGASLIWSKISFAKQLPTGVYLLRARPMRAGYPGCATQNTWLYIAIPN